MASKKDYFGMSYIVSVILAIIPITSLILGILTRFSEGKIVAGLLRYWAGTLSGFLTLCSWFSTGELSASLTSNENLTKKASAICGGLFYKRFFYM